MSHSRKKPFITISKTWSKFKEHAFRHRAKVILSQMSNDDFDPDRDFMKLTNTHKKQGDYGTRIGFDISPTENDDTWLCDSYEKSQRK